jgi:hypothetical protein
MNFKDKYFEFFNVIDFKKIVEAAEAVDGLLELN